MGENLSSVDLAKLERCGYMKPSDGLPCGEPKPYETEFCPVHMEMDRDPDGLTPKQRAFIEAYREAGTVRTAMEAAGTSRTMFKKWRRQAPFRQAQADAKLDANDRLVEEARRRATEGWDEPVFFEGVVVGYKRKFSDSLLQFLIKGDMPEQYRERFDHRHSGDLGMDARTEAMIQGITANPEALAQVEATMDSLELELPEAEEIIEVESWEGDDDDD